MVKYTRLFLFIIVILLLAGNGVMAGGSSHLHVPFAVQYINVSVVGGGGGGNGGNASTGYWGFGGSAGDVAFAKVNVVEGDILNLTWYYGRGASYDNYIVKTLFPLDNTSIRFMNGTLIAYADLGLSPGPNWTLPGTYSEATGKNGYSGKSYSGYMWNFCNSVNISGSEAHDAAEPGITSGNTQIGAAGLYCGGGGGGGLYDGVAPVSIRYYDTNIRAGGDGALGEIIYNWLYYIPTGIFYASKTTPITGETITFYANSTYADAFQWTFGDGATSTLQNPTHSYAATGYYNVSLRVDNDGYYRTTTNDNYIQVLDTTPYAQFSGNTTYGLSPLAVKFTDETNSTSTAWNWSFGDNNFSTSSSPTYTFTGAGKYNVSLNVSNSGGYNITLKQNYINVSASLYNPMSYISLTPSSQDLGITQYGLININVKNITGQSIHVDLEFNKSSVNIIKAINNFSVYPGLLVVPVYDNTSGHVSVDVSRIDGTTMSFGNTITPIVDLNFTAVGYSNITAPINYLSANELMDTGDREGIVSQIPSVINTTNTLFTFNVLAYNIATNTKILSMVKFNATGSGVYPYDVETDMGTAMFQSNYGKVAFNLTAQGYYPLSQSVNITSNSQIILKMTSFSGSTQSTWYSPHQVRITILDSYYAHKMYDTNVYLSAVSNTFPTGAGSDWLTAMYGVNAAAANDMMNGTLIMSGITDRDGSVVFTMLSSIAYTMHIVNTTSGIDHTATIYPLENDYNVWVDTTETQSMAQSPYIYNTTLTYEEPNSSYSKFGVVYQDVKGKTTSLKFQVFCIDNGTEMYNITQTGFGTSPTFANYTIKIKNAEQYTWKYNATRVI